MSEPLNRRAADRAASSCEGSMLIVGDPEELRREVDAARTRGGLIGVVPTMGALHAGHMSLIYTARAECDFLIATIFVNPTQFGPNEDYQRYPRTPDQDFALCAKAGVDLVYRPSVETMYPADYATYVEVEGISTILEGAFRPGHFRGVATIVLKLFNTVRPDFAYFGRKDYQQQALIKKLVRDLDLAVEIRTCPTVREADGLALSSRNQYLNPEERQKALTLSQSLRLAKDRLIAGETDIARICDAMLRLLRSVPGIEVDYATVVHPDTMRDISAPLPEMVALVAARIGRTRLIDNLPIKLP